MSNININVTFNLDKDMVAMLVGLLGGPLGVEKEKTVDNAGQIEESQEQPQDEPEVVLDRPSKFDEWKQAHPALGMLCDKLELELTDESVPRFVRQAARQGA